MKGEISCVVLISAPASAASAKPKANTCTLMRSTSMPTRAAASRC